METGGIGSDTPDAKPWWRVSLERTQLLQPGGQVAPWGSYGMIIPWGFLSYGGSPSSHPF